MEQLLKRIREINATEPENDQQQALLRDEREEKEREMIGLLDPYFRFELKQQGRLKLRPQDRYTAVANQFFTELLKRGDEHPFWRATETLEDVQKYACRCMTHSLRDAYRREEQGQGVCTEYYALKELLEKSLVGPGESGACAEILSEWQAGEDDKLKRYGLLLTAHYLSGESWQSVAELLHLSRTNFYKVREEAFLALRRRFE